MYVSFVCRQYLESCVIAPAKKLALLLRILFFYFFLACFFDSIPRAESLTPRLVPKYNISYTQVPYVGTPKHRTLLSSRRVSVLLSLNYLRYLPMNPVQSCRSQHDFNMYTNVSHIVSQSAKPHGALQRVLFIVLSWLRPGTFCIATRIPTDATVDEGQQLFETSQLLWLALFLGPFFLALCVGHTAPDYFLRRN